MEIISTHEFFNQFRAADLPAVAQLTRKQQVKQHLLCENRSKKHSLINNNNIEFKDLALFDVEHFCFGQYLKIRES